MLAAFSRPQPFTTGPVRYKIKIIYFVMRRCSLSNQSNKKDNNWIWLPAMIFCFACGLWPIALVILFWKVANDGKSTGKRGKTAAKAAAEARAKVAKTVKSKKAKGGTGLIVGGAILSAIFGIGTMGFATEFVESLFMGDFFSDELTAVLACLAALVAGLVMICVGVGKNRRRERWLGYLGYIGANQQVALAPMAASFGVPVRRLCDDLRKMLAEKVLPNGYLDLAAGKLILSETGYQAPVKAEPEPEQEPAPEQPQDDNAILAEIRAVNDAIPDPVMSAKIDRIGEITSKILDYQRRNPGKDSQLRSFLNYYLPTTLKILRSYAQLDAQGVEGENITAAKQRIEGMMDKVVEGFETQLDKLFADSAMDISSDVAVLEQMLEKDGLSSNQSMGMTL